METAFLVTALILGAIGLFALGRVWERERTQFWKIAWIHREHDCARHENRAPMTPKQYEEAGHPKLG